MAFFKFRKGGDEPSATPTVPESVEAMRTRAKHRLIGASVLVLLGVVGFPLLFDKQPRPISVDIPIEIPDKSKAKPLTVPLPLPAAAPQAPAASAAAAASVVVQAEPASDNAKPSEPAKAVDKPADKAGAKAVEKPVAAKTAVDDGSKAQALLDGNTATKSAAAGAGRFVVQVGAYADAARAREVRQKVEHAGLKTYTQAVETKDGHRIRVRVGPFADKAEADKVADRIRKLGLPAGILNL